MQDMKHKIKYLIVFLLLIFASPSYAINYLFVAPDGMTGGTTGKLDNIDQCDADGSGYDLQNKDACLVWDQSSLKHLVYIYNSTSEAAESSPDVIAPDTWDGGAIGAGRWIKSDSYEIEEFFPSGTDPDVDTAGKVGRDTDDHSLRGYDGSIQYVYSQKIKTISVTINSPLYLEESGNLVIWENRTGFSFVILAIYSKSDTDTVDYTLKEMNDPHDYSDTTTIEAITISTDGTDVYYDNLTSGIDHTVIETTHAIAFDNDSSDDPDSVQIVIVGYLNGDVD